MKRTQVQHLVVQLQTFDFGKDRIHDTQRAFIGILKRHVVQYQAAFHVEVHDMVGDTLSLQVQIGPPRQQVDGKVLLQVRLYDFKT